MLDADCIGNAGPSSSVAPAVRRTGSGTTTGVWVDRVERYCGGLTAAERRAFVGVGSIPLPMGQAEVKYAGAESRRHAALLRRHRTPRRGKSPLPCTVGRIVPRHCVHGFVSVRGMVRAAVRSLATIAPAGEMECAKDAAGGRGRLTRARRAPSIACRHASALAPHARRLLPWNLREDPTGQLWLIDWEDAGWDLHWLISFVTLWLTIHLAGSGPAKLQTWSEELWKLNRLTCCWRSLSSGCHTRIFNPALRLHHLAVEWPKTSHGRLVRWHFSARSHPRRRNPPNAKSAFERGRR